MNKYLKLILVSLVIHTVVYSAAKLIAPNSFNCGWIGAVVYCTCIVFYVNNMNDDEE